MMELGKGIEHLSAVLNRHISRILELEAEVAELTEARNAARAALTEAIAVVEANDWQARMWDRVFVAEKTAREARAEAAAMRRDHEAMNALRNTGVYLVRKRDEDGRFRAEATHESTVGGFRTGWVEVTIESDPAEAILKAATRGG